MRFSAAPQLQIGGGPPVGHDREGVVAAVDRPEQVAEVPHPGGRDHRVQHPGHLTSTPAGRVLATATAGRIGAETGLRTSAAGLAAGLGLWLAAGPDPTLIIAFAVAFGLASGAYAALFPELPMSSTAPPG